MLKILMGPNVRRDGQQSEFGVNFVIFVLVAGHPDPLARTSFTAVLREGSVKSCWEACISVTYGKMRSHCVVSKAFEIDWSAESPLQNSRGCVNFFWKIHAGA